MRVVRLKPYLRAMKGMGLDDAAMRKVEAAILAAPGAHPIVPGLRGIRKMRFARPGAGKRGGGRAIYYVMGDARAARDADRVSQERERRSHA